MYASILCVIVKSWLLSSYTHTFPFLSSSVSDYSYLLSSSGENNLAALARGRCHPGLDVMALSLLQLLASPWDFLTCHQCIWQMHVRMLLWNTVSPFGHLFFFWSLTISSLPFLPFYIHLLPVLGQSCSFHCPFAMFKSNSWRVCSWKQPIHQYVAAMAVTVFILKRLAGLVQTKIFLWKNGASSCFLSPVVVLHTTCLFSKYWLSSAK